MTRHLFVSGATKRPTYSLAVGLGPLTVEKGGDVHAPARKYEVNVNTMILRAGFAATAIGWGMIWGRFTGDVSAMALKYDAWIISHGQMQKDRLTAVTGVEARTH